MRIQNQSIKSNIGFKNKIFLVIGVLILLFAGFNLVKTWRQNKEVNKEISSLELEIKNLEKDNLELQELIEYFNSDAYIEEKARVSLGLQKAGEKLIIGPEALAVGLETSSDKSLDQTPKSNPQKWWHYFFK